MQAPLPTLPIDIPTVIMAAAVGLGLVIAIAGFTARFALRPVVEAIARFRESSGNDRALEMLERRMDLLEQELQPLASLRVDLERLRDTEEFQRQLEQPKS